MAKTINAKRELPSQEELHELLTLDRESGLLFWKVRPVSMFTETSHHSQEHVAKYWNTRYGGKEAFTWNISGYRFGTLHKEKFAAHRVIWKMETGEEPDEIDHINGDRSDNRMSNLRNVDRTGNATNTSRPANNTSGHIGIIWNKRNRNWNSRIKSGGRSIHLGCFDTIEEAIACRKAAEANLGFHPNHGKVLGD